MSARTFHASCLYSSNVCVCVCVSLIVALYHAYNCGISMPFQTLSLIFHQGTSFVSSRNNREIGMIGRDSCKNLMERRDLTGDFKLSGV